MRPNASSMTFLAYPSYYAIATAKTYSKYHPQYLK